MQSIKVAKVDKSLLGKIAYSRKDVLKNEVDRSIREHNLHRAMKMGNVYKAKVEIKFENRYGQRMLTEGTIWAVTENYIMMKGGKLIPVRSICEVVV